MRVLVALLPLVALASPAAASIRCGPSLISEGQTALELTAACGAPAHIARRTVVTPGATKGARVFEEVETWTYPGEPGTFTRLIEIRRGVVATIATAGFGLDVARCTSPAAGTTLGELEIACGAPAARSAWIEERTDRAGRVRRVVQHERWTVSAGPGRFLRILDFEDGRLVTVTTGGRTP